jgi:hypothetical protein
MPLASPWLCTNPACQEPGGIAEPSSPEGAPPRCRCGAIMKRRYSSPVFCYLDFLREDDEPALSRSAVRDSTRMEK